MLASCQQSPVKKDLRKLIILAYSFTFSTKIIYLHCEDTTWKRLADLLFKCIDLMARSPKKMILSVTVMVNARNMDHVITVDILLA